MGPEADNIDREGLIEDDIIPASFRRAPGPGVPRHFGEGGSMRKADTCFDHGRIGKVIYQRKQGGPWYVFRHNPPRPGDEFLKLVRKDDVTPQIAAYDKAMRATR